MIDGHNKSLGERGEDYASIFLKNSGYKIMKKNFRYKTGELDIIALEGETIVFVEVKTRSGSQFGEPEESIDNWKVNKIKKTAAYYLLINDFENIETRFDVISLRLLGDSMTINHIKDAF